MLQNCWHDIWIWSIFQKQDDTKVFTIESSSHLRSDINRKYTPQRTDKNATIVPTKAAIQKRPSNYDQAVDSSSSSMDSSSKEVSRTENTDTSHSTPVLKLCRLCGRYSLPLTALQYYYHMRNCSHSKHPDGKSEFGCFGIDKLKCRQTFKTARTQTTHSALHLQDTSYLPFRPWSGRNYTNIYTRCDV